MKQLKSRNSDIQEHATIIYKMYTGRTTTSFTGWKPTSYRCKYCIFKHPNKEAFINHLDTCKGLDD